MQSGREKTNHSRPERSLSFPFSLNCFTFLLLFPSISFLLLTLSLFHCFYLRVFWGWGEVRWQELFFFSFSLLPALSLPSVFGLPPFSLFLFIFQFLFLYLLYLPLLVKKGMSLLLSLKEKFVLYSFWLCGKYYKEEIA